MKTLVMALAILAFSTGLASAKPKKKTNAKVDPAKMSEMDLRNTAESELHNVAIPRGAVVPMSRPDDAMVSTDILREQEKEPLAASEFELGLQSYRPQGSGKVSEGESYSFAGLSAKPMILAGGRHWFLHNLRTDAPWRAGLGFLGGFSSNTMQIQTNRGFIYDNVHLNSWLALAGPEAEYFLDGRRHFAVGAKVSGGRLLTTQSSANSTINQSQGIAIWEAAGHLRYQPSAGFFVRAAYARRGNLGADKGIQAQENNFEALIGFGM